MIVVEDPEGERKLAIITDHHVLGVGTHFSMMDTGYLVHIEDEEVLQCSEYQDTAAISMLEKSIRYANVSFEQSLGSEESRKIGGFPLVAQKRQYGAYSDEM
jgi:hypothetical protein